MRKIFFTLSILSSGVFAIAQPTLTQTNFAPVIGESQLYYVADTNTVLDNTTGANVIFDYSNMHGYGLTQTQYIVDPVTTTFTSYFPTATTADTTGGSPINKNYSELHAPDSLAKTGIVVDVPTYGVVTAQYDQNPEITMKFPFNYGNSYTDDYAGLVSLINYSVTTNGNGNAIVNADAWGTLQLPQGVLIDSVIRVRTIESLITDTIVIPFVITINPIAINAEYINYYKPSISKFPLLSIISGTYTQDNNVLDSSRVIISQYPMFGVGINEVEEDMNISIFPNPSNNDVATLSFSVEDNGPVKVTLLNSLGQKISTIFDGEMNPGENKLKVKTSNLSKGLYFVSISYNNKTVTKKIIIE